MPVERITQGPPIFFLRSADDGASSSPDPSRSTNSRHDRTPRLTTLRPDPGESKNDLRIINGGGFDVTQHTLFEAHKGRIHTRGELPASPGLAQSKDRLGIQHTATGQSQSRSILNETWRRQHMDDEEI